MKKHSLTKINIWKDQDFQKKISSTFVCVFLVLPNILQIINYFLYDLIHLSFPIGTLIIYLSLLILGILSLPSIFKSLNFYHLFVIILIYILFGLSALFHMESADLTLQIMIDFTIQGLPLLLIGGLIFNNKYANLHFYIASLIIFVSSIFSILLFKNSEEGYSQSMAYLMLPATFVFFNQFFSRKSWLSALNFILFIFQTLFIIMVGARAPLVPIVIYVFLMPIVSFKQTKTKSIIWFTILITCIFVYIMFKDVILNILAIIFEKIGVSDRLLNYFRSGFFHDSNRYIQYSYVIKLIFYKPFGTGIGHDRILIFKQMQFISNQSGIYGWYSHNVLLDWFLHFGIIGGSAICSFYIYYIKKFFISYHLADSRDHFLVFILLAFVPLMFSGFYLNDTFFMLLLGYILTFVKWDKNNMTCKCDSIVL